MFYICEQDKGSNRMVYETGKYTFHGDILMGSVLEAKGFESVKDACEYVSRLEGRFFLGFTVVNIADCTMEKIRSEVKEGNYKGLYAKFHDPMYVA